MNSRVLSLSLVGAFVFLASCTNTGAFISTNRTTVELSEGNYEIVATNVEGSSEASYILGLSYSSGMITQSMSLARVSGSSFLYQDALSSLWANYESEYSTVNGEKLALTNVRYDADILNLIVYNEIKLSVRADVVKFVD